MAQAKASIPAASEKGGNGQNDPPVTTPGQSQGHPKASKYELKENIQNINIDMSIGELLGVTKCKSYAKEFEIFKFAGDITQYTKVKFQAFLTKKCQIDEFSAQFIELGKAYDKLKMQQNQQLNGPWHNSCPNVSMKEINEFLEGIITIQSDFLRPLNRQWKYEHGSASATFVGVFEDFFMFGTNQHVVSEYSKEHNGSHLISICLQCSGSKQSLAFACEPKQSILMETKSQDESDSKKKERNDDEHERHMRKLVQLFDNFVIYPRGDNECDFCLILVSKRQKLNDLFESQMNRFEKCLIKEKDNEKNKVSMSKLVPIVKHSELKRNDWLIIGGQRVNGLSSKMVNYGIGEILEVSNSGEGGSSVSTSIHGVGGISGGGCKVVESALCGLAMSDYNPGSKGGFIRVTTFDDNMIKFMSNPLRYGQMIESPTIAVSSKQQKQALDTMFESQYKSVLRRNILLGPQLSDKLPRKEMLKGDMRQYRSPSPTPEAPYPTEKFCTH